MISQIINFKKIVTFDIDTNSIIESSPKSIIIEDGKIKEMSNSDLVTNNIIDASGYVLTPGFIDSHSHLIFSSNRSEDYNDRVNGSSYLSIASRGGGIQSSINSLRNKSKEELINECQFNIDNILKSGTTTLEVKSGYGLNTANEIKSLEVVKKLNESNAIDLVPTFMGAHDFPSDISNESYIDIICTEMLPEVSDNNLAEFCDIFYEEGYFTKNQVLKIVDAAYSHGFDIKLHVDEFSDSNGARLASEVGAISADHLMMSNNLGLQSMAQNNVIATLLPGTTLFLGLNSYANGRNMINLGCHVSIATDFNPGSCTIYSIPIIMALSTLYCGLTIKEAFLGVTYNAAKALKRENSIGLLKEGYKADILFWDITSINEIPYWFNSDRLAMIMKDGKLVQ